MECKHGLVNLRRVSDPRSAFLPAFRVTGISDNWYKSTMGVIEIGLKRAWSAEQTCGRTWEDLGALATSRGVRVKSLGAPGNASEKCESTLNHDRAFWENQHLRWQCCWCVKNPLLLLSVE